jgi:hypothetical protein
MATSLADLSETSLNLVRVDDGLLNSLDELVATTRREIHDKLAQLALRSLNRTLSNQVSTKSG